MLEGLSKGKWRLCSGTPQKCCDILITLEGTSSNHFLPSFQVYSSVNSLSIPPSLTLSHRPSFFPSSPPPPSPSIYHLETTTTSLSLPIENVGLSAYLHCNSRIYYSPIRGRPCYFVFNEEDRPSLTPYCWQSLCFNPQMLAPTYMYLDPQ